MTAGNIPVSPSTRGRDAGGSWESDGRRTAYAGITLDVLVIYALIVHGKETKAEYG